MMILVTEKCKKKYTITRKDRSRGRGGRVCIMVHKDLNFKAYTDLNCVDAENTEHLRCAISTKDGINTIVVKPICRSPNNNHKYDFKIKQSAYCCRTTNN